MVFYTDPCNQFGQERIDLLKEHGFWKVSEDFVDGISRQVEDILQRTHQLELQQEQDTETEAETEQPVNE